MSKFKLISESQWDRGKFFVPGSIKWEDSEELSIPILEDDQVVGFVRKVYREDESLFVETNFDDDSKFNEDESFLGLDLFAITSEITSGDEGEELEIIQEATLRALKIVPNNEQPERIATLVASAIPLAPPREWFENPKLKEPTMITITPDGRVFGHVAAWKSCHVGYQNQCVTPPHSPTNYAHFNKRPVKTADGTDVYAGALTFKKGHINMAASAEHANKYYSDVKYQAGQIVLGEDEHGIWMAGALNPDLSDSDLRILRSSAVSGDWRQGDLHGVCVVNIEGFPVPRAAASVKNDEVYALVAAGVIMDEEYIVEEQGDKVTEEVQQPEVKVEEDKKPTPTAEEKVVDFGSQLQGLIDQDPESEISVKAQELLSAIDESNRTPEPVTREDLDQVNKNLIALGKLVYKNSVNLPKTDNSSDNI